MTVGYKTSSVVIAAKRIAKFDAILFFDATLFAATLRREPGTNSGGCILPERDLFCVSVGKGNFLFFC